MCVGVRLSLIMKRTRDDGINIMYVDLYLFLKPSCMLHVCCRMSPVGFIGVGSMGAHMARNLLRNGVKLIVFDTNPACLKSFYQHPQYGANIETVASPAEVASHCKEIVTMLPNSNDVTNVFSAKRGILE